MAEASNNGRAGRPVPPGDLSRLAEFFAYPAPGRRGRLEAATGRLHDSRLREAAGRFVERLAEIDQGGWEELYTRTFDLEPEASPYVGWQKWGDDYRRGQLLALLSPRLEAEGVERDAELPDHLVPVLRYLDRSAAPPRDLTDIAPAAIRKMAGALRKAQTDNPYTPLLQVLADVLADRFAAAKTTDKTSTNANPGRSR